MTNDEYLKELASRGDGSLQAWFDAEHVDNTRSAKRAAAVERVRKAKDAGTSIGYAIVGREYYPWEAYETLIDLLTDDDGLRNNDGVAAEHGATRMTNLERLFVDSEQFRQAVSAFAFAHSDDCPTSPTQMVDWLMAPYVDAHSKPQSKTEQMLTEQSESLSDDLGHPTDMSQKSADCVRNDGKMSETGVRANDVDANDETATCNNSGDFVTHDSREKLEADVRQYANPSGGTGTLGACWEKKMLEFLDRQAEITHAETIHTYNLAAREARKVQKERIAELQAKVDELQSNYDIRLCLYEQSCKHITELEEELTKRDKGIARLKRQRDEARRELEKNRWEYCETCEHAEQVERLEAECDKLQDTVDNLRAECDESCVYKQEFRNMDKLEAERDALRAENTALKADSDECVPRAIKKRDEVIKILKTERDALAADLRDCERQRERLRQALGCAIDHAHEIVSLVNLDGEVIG